MADSEWRGGENWPVRRMRLASEEFSKWLPSRPVATQEPTMSDDLKAKLGYMVPAHVEVQSGAGTNAPAAVFADYDYTVEDGNHGLHQSAKQACEPTIVYVRADALDARDAEIARLRSALGRVQDKRREMEMGDLDSEEAINEADEIARSALANKETDDEG